jgi:transposase
MSKKYTAEQRQAVLARLAPPFNEPVKEVAKAEGLSLTTIYNWINAAKKQARPIPEEEAPPSSEAAADWTARDKFTAVVETAAMNEAERSAYCRSRGVYPEELALWRKACEQATDWADDQVRQRADANKEATRRIRELERELFRKEKALAEAAALLVLRKKAAAIWGDEDE